MTIDQIVVSMTPKIGNNNYSDLPPEVAVSKDLLDNENLA